VLPAILSQGCDVAEQLLLLLLAQAILYQWLRQQGLQACQN
jgi:hypothetical protein